MNRQYLSIFLIALFLLTSCAIKPTQRHPYVNEAFKAEHFIETGKHKQAAALYQSLVKNKPLQQNEFSLLAASEYIKSSDSQAAQTLLSTLDPALLSAQQRNKLNLLHAQISLSNGEAEQAIIQLNTIQVYNLNPKDQITYYQSLAFAYSLTGDLLQSTKARIQLTPLLEDSDHRDENYIVILNTLNLLPLNTLTLQQPPAPDILGGWMHLSRLLRINKQDQNSTELQTHLNNWRQLFPDHPANSEFLHSFLEGSTHSFTIPSAIALLLPGSGRYAQAARAIKEGFMAAYQQPQTNYQPSFRFYDSTTDSAVGLYHQAILEGAELVIGPLRKDKIQNLAFGAELTIPVLALNHVQNLSKNNLFQFGLSPIDEAKQISVASKLDGNNNALILTANTKKGQRIANYLSESWQQTSGMVLETQTYNPRENDYSTPIKKLLNLDESKYRYNRLRRLLGLNIEYTERRRHDVDTILLSASPRSARSIYPQLLFFRATHIPVYATPEIYSGQPSRTLDIDLNNITFCDIPWLFPDAYPGTLSHQSLRRIWQSLPNKYLRLVALGIDAFNVIAHLEQLNNTPYPGASGTLSLNMDNRITRQLVCAKFIDGKPVLQDLSHEENNEIVSDDDSIYSEDIY